MCTNCLSQAEVAAGHAALAFALLKAPAHRFLADLGLVDAPDPVARDARTVAFLRRLDLDPMEILGVETVAAADAWAGAAAGQGPRPAVSAPAASTRPIGSHSLIAAQ